MTSTPNLCVECGEPLSIGSRMDRLFCSDRCKNEYHNRIRIENSREIRQILMILKRNRTILKILLGERSEIFVNRETMLKKGFEFDFHTHHLIAQTTKNEFIFCFNYGYRVMDKDVFKIVKKW